MQIEYSTIFTQSQDWGWRRLIPLHTQTQVVGLVLARLVVPVKRERGREEGRKEGKKGGREGEGRKERRKKEMITNVLYPLEVKKNRGFL